MIYLTIKNKKPKGNTYEVIEVQPKARKKKEKVEFKIPEFKPYVPPPPPDIKCRVCNDPLYEIYESIDPPICQWCEINT